MRPITGHLLSFSGSRPTRSSGARSEPWCLCLPFASCLVSADVFFFVFSLLRLEWTSPELPIDNPKRVCNYFFQKFPARISPGGGCLGKSRVRRIESSSIKPSRKEQNEANENMGRFGFRARVDGRCRVRAGCSKLLRQGQARRQGMRPQVLRRGPQGKEDLRKMSKGSLLLRQGHRPRQGMRASLLQRCHQRTQGL